MHIVIPIRIERLKLWTRWTLETAGWLVCLGLLDASAAVGAFAAMIFWLLSGSDTILALGVGGGMLLGLAGVWQLPDRFDRGAKRLRRATTAIG